METLEETIDEGDESFRPRRRYAFRLVASEKPVTESPRIERQQGVGNGRGGEEGSGRDGLGVLSLDLDDADDAHPSRARKVWILAATSEEVRFRSPKGAIDVEAICGVWGRTVKGPLGHYIKRKDSTLAVNAINNAIV